MIEAPQGYVIREECRKAAWQNGYRRQQGEEDGWAKFGSTTAHGHIFLAADSGNGIWLLALDHAGVTAELGLPAANVPGPGLARFVFPKLAALYAVLPRVYTLALSLPDGPLQSFIEATRSLPRATEAERLVVQRIGQDIFRERLIAYWNGRCPLTGIREMELLRASHIKPWAKASSDAERLDVHNGLLLSALWDAAFDRGLVSFADDGSPLFSPTLGAEARAALCWAETLVLTAQHRAQLDWHRQHVFIHSRPATEG